MVTLCNDGEELVDVFFDDLRVTHQKSLVIQTNDYYPFGLTFNSYQRENSVSQRYEFQSQEHIDDLGLNWDSFKWRNHQPEIGRFFNVDPLAEKYAYNSPYAFSENQVVTHRELEGLEKVSIQQALGNSYKFYGSYNIQRKTSGGKRFFRRLSSQNKINVLYFVFDSPEHGITRKVSNMEEFRRVKERRQAFSGLHDKEVEMAMGENELILIGVKGRLFMEDDGGGAAAATLNHEEVAHGDDLLDGNMRDLYGDHEYYYGYPTYASPSDEDVRNDPQYANSRAKKQFDEIFKIITEELKKQAREIIETGTDERQENDATNN